MLENRSQEEDLAWGILGLIALERDLGADAEAVPIWRRESSYHLLSLQSSDPFDLPLVSAGHVVQGKDFLQGFKTGIIHRDVVQAEMRNQPPLQTLSQRHTDGIGEGFKRMNSD